jgi:F-type H+-transporting ATPase subunit a
MILGASLLALILALPQTEARVAETPAAAVATTPGTPTPAPTQELPAAHSSAPPGDHTAAPAGGEKHEAAGDVLMHHVLDQPNYQPLGLPITFPTKHLFFLILVMVIVIVVARMAVASYRNGTPSGIGTAVETLVVYVRDEMAEKNIGHGQGARYTPLLLSFFFFILVAALVGLLPFSATSTGNISVTLALAFISFLAQQHAGISNYGVVGHFKNLLPHGIPLVLLPVMIVVEVLGMFTKPFALMVRLFANMMAGHMMITALLLLVPVSAQVSQNTGIAMIPVSLGLALFIMLLEVLVAFIQAYVFTLFSAIFIGMYAHPSH